VIWIAFELGMKKAEIIESLGYPHPKVRHRSAAYRDVRRAIAQVEADQRRPAPLVMLNPLIAEWAALPKSERMHRVRDLLSRYARART
jgi:hypothetical protein